VPGAVLRFESVAGVPSGGRGWRILYRTQTADGSPAVSSGLVFAPGPQAPAVPPGGRNVIAWAHPTVGLGVDCAPSRAPDVEADIPGLADFLAAGWRVVATDYADLGTPGPSQFLVGAAEAHDVLNSVRTARRMPGVDAGTRVGLWGTRKAGTVSCGPPTSPPATPPGSTSLRSLLPHRPRTFRFCSPMNGIL
jgi:hypothetical protein